MTLIGKRVLVTGSTGFLGRHVVAALEQAGTEVHHNPGRIVHDLRSGPMTQNLFRAAEPEMVIHLAAHCGGIGANLVRPADMLRDNALMAANVLDCCRMFAVEKLVTVGSVCGYPERPKTIPFVEEEYWDGYPEPTNAAYGISKRLLLELCQAYRRQYELNAVYLILANLYGPGDNFDLQTSHCIPAIIRIIANAQEHGHTQVTLWGSGTPTRDFLHVRDAARAIVLASERYNEGDPVNVGTGLETSIKSVAESVAAAVGWWQGRINWDRSRPDGQPRRVLDTAKAADRFGFRAEVGLGEGLVETVAWWTKQAAGVSV